MNPNREEGLFQLALAKPVEKRGACLDVMCQGDAGQPRRQAGRRPGPQVFLSKNRLRPEVSLQPDA